MATNVHDSDTAESDEHQAHSDKTADDYRQPSRLILTHFLLRSKLDS